MKFLTENDYEQHVKKGKTVIDFFAGWCGPCKMLAPIFEKLPDEFRDISFYKVDVEKEAKLASVHSVLSIPTILFYKDGKEVSRHTGFLPSEEFKKKIQEFLG
jgi:thioredoxin 1